MVADYPYLANLGPDYWRGCVAGGAIYGVPRYRCMFSRKMPILTCRELFEKAGVEPDVQPETWDQLVELCKELTDRRATGGR